MSDASDRTIPATPRRREAARQQGMMPTSALPAWLATVVTALLLAPSWAAATLPAATGMMQEAIGTAGRVAEPDVEWHAFVSGSLLVPTAALVLASGAAGIAVRVLLDGAAWRSARIAPTLHRINPLAGLTRIFSATTAVALFGNAFALAVLVMVAAWVLAPMLTADAWSDAVTDPAPVFARGQRAILLLAAAGAVVAAAQWGLARRRFERRIRMTPQEFQDEARSLQADPKVRLMREQARRPPPAAPRSAAPDSHSDR